MVRGNKEKGQNIKGEVTSFAKPQKFKSVAFGRNVSAEKQKLIPQTRGQQTFL